MIGASMLFMALGVAARRNGWTVTGEALTDIAFPCSLVLSMPFWMMKGQPWRAQVGIVGGTLLLLVAVAWLGSAT